MKTLPQAVRDYLSEIGRAGGEACTGEPKESAGRLGGKAPRDRTAAAKLGWNKRRSNGQHKANCNVAASAK